MASSQLKYLERVFTVIILAGCLISIYISSTFSTVSSQIGGSNKRYVFHSENGHLKQSMFGQLFGGSHKHSHLFMNQHAEFRPINQSRATTLKPRSNETKTDSTLSWFRPYRVKPLPTNLQQPQHPSYRNFLLPANNVCNDSYVDILIYIQSATSNFQRRQILRETWANANIFKTLVVKTVFILGRPRNVVEQMRISNEYSVYGDIVQGDFLDTPFNLTLKSLLVTRWIAEHCLHARYVIKADDDIYVNIFEFVEKFVSSISHKPKTIVCHLRKAGTLPIVRNPTSKWFIPEDIMPGDTLPQFCPGYALMFTGDLVPIMYAETFNTPIIPPDDVYMFGLLLQRHKDVSFIDVQSNFTLNQKIALEQYQGNSSVTYVVSSAWGSDAMERFWFSTLERLSPWASEHSRFGVLERRRSLLNATFIP